MSGDSKDKKDDTTEDGGGTATGAEQTAATDAGQADATERAASTEEADAADQVDATEEAVTEDADATEQADATDAPGESGDEKRGDATPAEPVATPAPKRAVPWSKVVAFGLLPALALLLALTAGFLKWQANSARIAEDAADAATQAATESTIALLSYSPDTVEQQLGAARNLLTGEFQQSYTDLTTDVVIPGAKEQQIAALASVPAAAPVSADPDHAVVLLFVNQTVTVGQQPPTDTASSVRVTLDKVDGRWLISAFDPV
ncbi:MULTISPECIES: hypothetical protein [Mycobacteriaceae]|uniref:Uncharacterized protein n=1 Tax=Mycolicibacterium parafortuitum TaxID=39692 RepID=A0ACC6MCE7_MYCPF|nr:MULTISPECIES: hypothetical protein [Mycobacteriaceae]MDZ5084645.1 hypothetical protein [Mycolicibacterium parafortuitum]BBA72654.1 Mce associated membrane protein [Mycobacterium sp. PO1]BBA72708.1 Mce associated membrane protein [Mycobacterium sp. PO2]GFM20243.1 Mce associated membrane protein [Mycobacterium sp. PO1]GFM23287.1 Mce associated membrane protein [Mycobacterium sp. PO2]